MPTASLYTGDAKDTLASLPAESVQTCVTSPPYWGLRDYGEDGQLGLEETPEEYVQKLVDVFREVRRVLRDDGTVWLNIGDSYAQNPAKGGSGTFNGRNGRGEDYAGAERGMGKLKEKDLTMIPSRVAMALQEDGWWVRSRIVWAKGVSFCDDYSGSCMPESVTDRPTSSHEYIFLLSKSKQYFYDADAIREESVKTQAEIEQRVMEDRQNLVNDDHQGERSKGKFQGPDDVDIQAGRNVRDVWTFSPKPFPDAHFAVYPPELIEPCVKAGTSKKGQCPECGAPWRRVVDHTPGEYDYSERGEEVGHNAQASGTQKEPAKRKTTGWKPTCGCNRAGEDLCDDAFEIIESPLSSRSEEDPTMETGRRGMNRPRSEDEEKRRMTRARQRRYAEKLKHSPHRSKMEDEVGASTFEHYIRKDTSGARPVPADILAEWKRKGWVDEPKMPGIEPHDPETQTVLDPFSGAGTTGVVALAKGRDYIGIDLSQDYNEMAADRIRQDAPLTNEVSIETQQTPAHA